MVTAKLAPTAGVQSPMSTPGGHDELLPATSVEVPFTAMDEDEFRGRTPGELRQLTDKVYGKYAWVGKSCLSYFWPYTRNPEMFEVRRAIANATNGLRSTYGPVSLSISFENESAPELSDLLLFVKAANAIYDAADMALHEVVAEAVARGATWKQIGDVLGVQRTGAHKRFGKGLSPDRRTELLVERMMSDTVVAFWNELISTEGLGFDDEFWEAVPAEVAVSFAVRRFMRSAMLFTKCFASFTDEEIERSDDNLSNKLFQGLWKVYEVLKHSFHILQTPQALRTIVSYSKELPDDHPWLDANANTYFIQAISCIAYAFDHFNKMWEAWSAGEARPFWRQIAFVHDCMVSAQSTLARPECVHVLALIDEHILETGENVPLREHIDEDEAKVDSMELFTAYWKKDKKRIAELLGAEEVRDAPTLEELLELFD